MLIDLYEKYYIPINLLMLRIGYRLHIMGSFRTVRYIKKHRCNIARYGDGEFRIMMGEGEIGFQEASKELQEGLINVLKKNNSNLLLCVPIYMNTTKGCNSRAKSYWHRWGIEDGRQRKVVNMIKAYAGKYKIFGDSLLTRPYIDKKSYQVSQKLFNYIKELWRQKDILIVEGEQTCLGIGNDLFEGVHSIRRILAPAVNAWEYYDQIKEAVEKYYNNELVLIALGPTATVLAADLADCNIWALDIGHIDIEYEWFLQGVKEKTEIVGKYTNEARKKHGVETCVDMRYLRQIVCKVGC